MKSFTKTISLIIKGRCASHAAKVTERPLVPIAQDVKITKLPNGIIVASLEDYSPVSRLAIIYNSGARNETVDNLGINHYLRVLAMQSTQKSSGFRISKNVQQIGGNLWCMSNREQTIYAISSLRNHLSTSIDFLNQVATQPAFKSWEIVDSAARLMLDREQFKNTPDAVMIEALHKTAYRETLGNSLYITKDYIKSIKPKMFEEYVHKHHVSNGMAFVGLGVDHDYLIHQARLLTPNKADAVQPTKSIYYGGEARIHIAGPHVYASIVTEGLPTTSPQLLHLALLQQVLGGGSAVKYSPDRFSIVSKAAASVATLPYTASCLSASYSDSGLFGIQVVSNIIESKKVIRAVVDAVAQVTKNPISDADLIRAKSQLKAQLHFYGEDACEFLEWIGVEVLQTGQTVSIDQISSSIDKITVDEVNKIAKKVINGKPTLALVGDLNRAPHLDEIYA